MCDGHGLLFNCYPLIDELVEFSFGRDLGTYDEDNSTFLSACTGPNEWWQTQCALCCLSHNESIMELKNAAFAWSKWSIGGFFAEFEKGHRSSFKEQKLTRKNQLWKQLTIQEQLFINPQKAIETLLPGLPPHPQPSSLTYDKLPMKLESAPRPLSL